MFAWGHAVVKIRWLLVVAAILLMGVGAAWGGGVFNVLSSGGFDDPHSESVQVTDRMAAELGQREVDVLALYSSDTATVDDAAFRAPVTSTLDALKQRPDVASVVTYYDTHIPAFVSKDQHATFAAITLKADTDNGKHLAFKALRPALNAPGVKTQVGGVVAFEVTTDDAAKADIGRGEMFAMPILLILLILILGGLVAASMPVLIGVLAILGAFTTTRLITMVTDVSTFAVNTITLLGLGLAIDYSLLIISRFREELHSGHDPRTSVARTMATAGRTVLVSALTIGLALSSLLIFPQVFLHSIAVGGMAAVLVALLGALTVLPALLAILGKRIDAGRVIRRRKAAQAPATADQQGAWARMAHSVMRRPVVYIVVVLAVLGVFASPFLRAQFAGSDERVMPPGTEARVASERLAAEFPGVSGAPIETLVEGASDAQVQDLVTKIKSITGVSAAQVTNHKGQTTLVSVTYAGERTDKQTYDAVRAIRALPAPAGVQVLVGGRSAEDIDRLSSLGSRLPWMALIMAAVTLILLFLAFGSVTLAIQAVVTNLVAIGASFGVLVWIFQDGHLSKWLGFTPTGQLEPTVPILILAILFGLATDYEVFLVSRVREEWDTTGDHLGSVTGGLQRSGRIITAAALLLIVVVAGFTTSGIVFAKMTGLGILVAVAVDATLVQLLLVPAILRLLGRATWWAPGSLGRVYQRYGIRETAEPVAATPEPTAVR